MNLIKLMIFLRSGIGIFLVVAIIVGMCLPESMLEGFGFVVALILIVMLIGLFVNVFKSLK